MLEWLFGKREEGKSDGTEEIAPYATFLHHIADMYPNAKIQDTIQHFARLPPPDQEELLPNYYLAIEQTLAPEHRPVLRDLAVEEGIVDKHPRFRALMSTESAQVLWLGRWLLEDVLGQLSELGHTPSAVVARLPQIASPEHTPTSDPEALQMRWLLLCDIAREVYRETVDWEDEGVAARWFREAYERLYRSFGRLESFKRLQVMMPREHLDESNAEELLQRLKRIEEENLRLQELSRRLDESRRQAAEARHNAENSERRLQAVLDTVGEGVVTINQNGCIVMVNPIAQKMWGYSAEELMGKDLAMLMPEEYRAAHHHGLTRYLAYGKPRVLGKTIEVKGMHRSGAVFPMDLNITETRIGEERFFTGAVADISERREMQARLMLSDRLASMGTMAASVAHEINNPLTFIANNLSFATRVVTAFEEALAEPELRKSLPKALRKKAERLQTVCDALADATEGAGRVRDIVTNLKSFTRPQETPTAPEQVEDILEGSVRMAWSEIRHKAELVRRFEDTPKVFVNRSQIGQVFLNLLVNAAQAIPQGERSKHQITLETSTEGAGWVIVKVADTGKGIPAEVLPRIFDPFFTTKRVGEGTGLGLSICNDTITGMGGTITIASTLGKGTTFTIRLPATDIVELVDDPDEEVTEEIARRRARVLVIDDEEQVGRAIQRLLDEMHDVVPVTHGYDALKLLVQEQQNFDVIFCDLMMPEMTGSALLERLRTERPEVVSRVIFLTGGVFTREQKAFQKRVSNQFLDKPVQTSALLDVIHQALLRQHQQEVV